MHRFVVDICIPNCIFNYTNKFMMLLLAGSGRRKVPLVWRLQVGGEASSTTLDRNSSQIV